MNQWTIILIAFLVVWAFVTTEVLGMWFAKQAHGQSESLTPEQAQQRETERLMKKCIIYSDSTLAILKGVKDPSSTLGCNYSHSVVAAFSKSGYEIKSVFGDKIYMQRLP